MKPDFRCSASRQRKRPYSLDPERPEIVIPIAISRFLRRYQRLGVQFLYDRYKGLKVPGVWEYPLKGGILGDDMGLGKTIQVTAFVSRSVCRYNLEHISLTFPIVARGDHEKDGDQAGYRSIPFQERSSSREAVQRRLDRPFNIWPDSFDRLPNVVDRQCRASDCRTSAL